MLTHPLTQLLFNPFAGAAGFNLIACMVYLAAALIVAVAIVEQSFKQ